MKTTEPLPDAELAEVMRQTLNAAARTPEPELDRALAQIRQRIRTPAAPKNRLPMWAWASGMAVAASVALVVMVPRLTAPAEVAPVAELASMPAEDLQFLDDMDMLKTLDTL